MYCTAPRNRLRIVAEMSDEALAVDIGGEARKAVRAHRRRVAAETESTFGTP